MLVNILNRNFFTIIILTQAETFLQSLHLLEARYQTVMLISNVCSQYFVTLYFFPFLDQINCSLLELKFPTINFFDHLNSDQLYLEIFPSSPDYIQIQNILYEWVKLNGQTFDIPNLLEKRNSLCYHRTSTISLQVSKTC